MAASALRALQDGLAGRTVPRRQADGGGRGAGAGAPRRRGGSGGRRRGSAALRLPRSNPISPARPEPPAGARFDAGRRGRRRAERPLSLWTLPPSRRRSRRRRPAFDAEDDEAANRSKTSRPAAAPLSRNASAGCAGRYRAQSGILALICSTRSSSAGAPISCGRCRRPHPSMPGSACQ